MSNDIFHFSRKRNAMSSSKKNSFLDIYVQSIQKDNAFYKEKVSSLQKEMDELKAKNSEERKAAQQELAALKEDLSRMVKDVTTLRSQNFTLIEKLQEYEASYVPGTGSKKLKDALADCRKELRETVTKYNELVDGYDLAKEQYNSALVESNALRDETARLSKELERYQQLYQSATKELEENRQDIAVYMKENSELRQAMADQTAATAQSPSAPSTAESSDGSSSLVIALRQQLQSMTAMMESMQTRSSSAPKPDLSGSMKSAQEKLNVMSTKVNGLIATYTSDSSAQVVEMVSTVTDLRLSLLDLDTVLRSLADENRELKNKSASAAGSSQLLQRATTAEKKLQETQEKMKELSATVVQLSNERNRFKAEAEEKSSSARNTSKERELERRADEAERKVIELSTRTSTYEKRVTEISRRASAAEKQVQDLTVQLRAVTQERDLLKQKASSSSASSRVSSAQQSELQKQVQDLNAQLRSMTQERDSWKQKASSSSASSRATSAQQSELQKQLQEKDNYINQLRDSVMRLEKEIEEIQQNPPIPPIPDDFSLPRDSFAPQLDDADASFGRYGQFDQPSQPSQFDSYHNSNVPSMDAGSAAQSAEPAFVEADSSEDAVATVLQQMIEDPSSFNLDTIDDVSFPDCDFNDGHMELFTRFIRENDFPSLVQIDLSRLGWREE